MSTPPPHPGERLASYFDAYFKTLVGISTFGASLTFSKIIQTPAKPPFPTSFTPLTIQTYLSLSFLFFILDLALISFFASALSLYRPAAVRYFGTKDSEDRRTVMWYATAVSGLTFCLLIVAFIFLGLVVTAFAGSVGWVAVGFTVLFGLLGVGSIIWQSPIGSRAPGEPYSAYRDQRTGGYREDMTWEDRGKEAHFEESVLEAEDLEKDGRYENESPRISRRSTLVRPMPAPVPAYTEDLRRYRAVRASVGSGREGLMRQSDAADPGHRDGGYY